MAVALRCEGCGAALRVRESARHVTCEGCGAGLEVVREGGAVYTVIDEELQRESERAPIAEAAARALSRRPSRGSSVAAGAVTALAGAGAALLGVSAGGWWWIAAGVAVMLVGAGAALRALRSP
jgi:hypothetical protein